MGTSVGRRAPRTLNKLSDLRVKAARTPGYIGDGGGLWLQVSATGTKSWIFRYTLRGKSREMGLGPVRDVSLAEARVSAAAARKLLLVGADPLEARRAEAGAEATADARRVTFAVEAAAYIESHRDSWKNDKHAAQWAATLRTYANPVLGNLLVSEIDVEHVVKVLQPIWHTRTETASRVRGRIEKILDYATALKHRTGDNPARWRGHLQEVFAAPTKIAKTKHHAAMPYADIGEFMGKLRAERGAAARAVEFIVLTAARTTEALHAQWGEIDLERAVWIVPPERMKSKREHRVPLSKAAMKALESMKAMGDEGYVFPGAKEGRPLSNMAGLAVLERLGHGDLTVHGFRSTFRDWAAEQTNFPREVAEAALAHVLKDKTESAYQRGDLFEKRARLMQAWADYCARPKVSGNVTPIQRKVKEGARRFQATRPRGPAAKAGGQSDLTTMPALTTTAN